MVSKWPTRLSVYSSSLYWPSMANYDHNNVRINNRNKSIVVLLFIGNVNTV